MKAKNFKIYPYMDAVHLICPKGHIIVLKGHQSVGFMIGAIARHIQYHENNSSRKPPPDPADSHPDMPGTA